MYLRTTPRRNNDGSVVRYLQLAHSTWGPQAKRSRMQVICNLGREDANNRAALQRLVASVSGRRPGAGATAGEGLRYVESRPLLFDTTSTYFGLDEPDTPVARDRRGVPVSDADGHGEGAGDKDTDKAGFCSYGKSRDHRDDLPQFVVGMAVTRTGLPVGVWRRRTAGWWHRTRISRSLAASPRTRSMST